MKKILLITITTLISISMKSIAISSFLILMLFSTSCANRANNNNNSSEEEEQITFENKYKPHVVDRTITITVTNYDQTKVDIGPLCFAVKEWKNGNCTSAVYDYDGNKLFVYNDEVLINKEQTDTVFFDYDYKTNTLLLNDFHLNTIRSFSDMRLASDFVDGRAIIYHEEDFRAQYYYIYPDGTTQLIVPNWFHYPSGNIKQYPVRDGMRLCWHLSDHYYYFEKDGIRSSDMRYTSARSFSEGFAAVSFDGELWGYIDTNENVVIAPMFHNVPGDFHSGYAIVKKQNGKEVYINTSGEVLDPENLPSEKKPFINGFTYVPDYSRKCFELVDKTFTIKRPKVFNLQEQFNYFDWRCPEITYFYDKNIVEVEGVYYSSNGQPLISAHGNANCEYLYAADYKSREYDIYTIEGEILYRIVEPEF